MSLKTNNFELFKYEDSDLADLRFLHDSMDTIDKGINPFYVATLDSANTYKIVTGLNKTVLNDGYSIKVAIPSDSTGAVSIIVDSVTVPLKQVNGNDVTNFKANGVYSLTYYNSVFILASGGGADTVNFTSDKLLTGYSANDSNGEKVDGTMVNRGAPTTTLNCGGTYNIQEGYYSGGKVTANSLASQTQANADASKILQGYSAWVNGVKIPGTATIESLGGLEMETGKKYNNGIGGVGVDKWSVTLGIKANIILAWRSESTAEPDINNSTPYICYINPLLGVTETNNFYQPAGGGGTTNYYYNYNTGKFSDRSTTDGTTRYIAIKIW